jgi:hypothetical protein
MLEGSSLRAIADELAPGFAVSVRHHHGHVVVALDHPASIGVQLALPSEQEYSDEGFAAWLRVDPEVRRIRQAPGALAHPETCRRVYIAAQGLVWGRGTLHEVTAMLVDAGGLTEPEADWLRSTT